MTDGRAGRARWASAVLAALGLLAGACGTGPGTGTPTRTVTGTVTVQRSSPAATAPTATGGSLVAGRYQPLWPFADEKQARDWQESYRSGGHQPWHLDAERTALSFTQGFLGFTGVDQVVKRTVTGGDARVSVGIRGEGGGRPGIAAVIHLVRFGAGPDAPWEVVGTDDTTFSLTTPGYGAVVSSPVRVGGRITGVDESIRVQVRATGSARPLGERCCVAAGGDGVPWSATVTFRAAPGRTLTLVASTGGHVAKVERFAVTGVRVAR
ncbi:Gmad2 immunoglobulin-like domain-containing protein [Microbispora camponoti]|uniref:Gmad2 immunoglobulin-like domain-containing protein n=1 Tax=Microbispora bryophytorum TaxID=1460882 RepID=UPI001CC29A0F|nr:Gmad2 immunoglobulin-like domain-containing protein [Microbispora camponoti]